jgi:hypothetical protein
MSNVRRRGLSYVTHAIVFPIRTIPHAASAIVLTITTTRFSLVVQAFAERYPDAVARLNNSIQEGPASGWATNAALRAAANFSLTDDSGELLGFHDNPKDMWASTATMPLVQELSAQRILRFTVTHKAPSLLRRIFGGLFRGSQNDA